MPEPAIPPEDLAARVAARVCHDLMSPASAIKAGLSFLGDTESAETRAEGRTLVGAGLQALEDRTALYRLALGRGKTAQETAALARLAERHFADLRPRLEWAVTAPSLPGTAARAALHLAIILSECLPAGGEARISARSEAGFIAITGEATGARVRLHDDTRAGLAGEPCPEGPGGRWAFAAFLRAEVEGAGGAITIETREQRVTIAASVPEHLG